jgi:magnesium transporter
VADCLRGHQRAKLEHFGDTTFLVLQPARYVDASESVEFSEVDVFMGADFIVTVVDDDLADVREARATLEAHPEILAKGAFAAAWAIFQQLIDSYVPVLDGVENDIDEIEEQLFSRDPNVAERIFKLQREVIALQRATSPLAEMLDRMQRIVVAVTGAAEAPAFRDADDRAHHVDARVAGFKHTLDSALTVNATLADEARNEEMKKLTEFGLQQNEQVKKISSWAAILFAPTLVGTIYGMNFRDMPELSWPFGYPLALVAMLATSTTLYAVFKRKGWL